MSNDFHHRTGSGDRSNTLLFILFSGQDQPRPLSAAVRWKGWVPIFLAIANEVVVIGSVLLSIYRYGMKELLDPESEFQKGGSKS